MHATHPLDLLQGHILRVPLVAPPVRLDELARRVRGVVAPDEVPGVVLELVHAHPVHEHGGGEHFAEPGGQAAAALCRRKGTTGLIGFNE